MQKENTNIEHKSIYEKIMNARLEFQNSEVKKSGRNTFQNFTYFELDDIIPTATRICTKLKLFTISTILDTEAILNVVDWETGDNVEFRLSLPPFPEENNQNKSMQGAGARITYARRYLYLTFLDIAQEDKVNKNIGKPKQQTTQKKRVTKNKKANLTTVITEDKMDELRKETGLNLALNSIQENKDGDITVRDITAELVELKNSGVISLNERISSKKHLDAVLSS